ncbi:MAG: ADP-dependent glucokinase/phosphofructokinase [Candidatus Micrarchaeota archaeon]
MRYSSSLAWAKQNLVKKAAFAFNANIDAIRGIEGKEIEALVLPRELKGLPETMRTGSGREVLVSSRTLNFLNEVLGRDYTRIGGQVGNVANAAAALGVDSYAHVTSKTREQCELLNPRVKIALGNRFVCASSIKDKGIASVHFVLEFEGGDKIYGKNIPASNRFIASYDPINFRMKIDPAFKRNILPKLKQIDRIILAGFHLLTHGNVRRKVREISALLRKWKKINKNLEIHLEMGEFQKRDALKLVLSDILPLCDSLGINETEVNQTAGLLKMKKEVLPVCRALLKRVPTVVFHRREYAFALSKKHGKEQLEHALRFGSILAAYKAKYGKWGKFEELERYLKRAKIQKVKRSIPKNIAFVPSLLVTHPKETVGLGDSFTVGYFLTRKK